MMRAVLRVKREIQRVQAGSRVSSCTRTDGRLTSPVQPIAAKFCGEQSYQTCQLCGVVDVISYPRLRYPA
jgi:hypothetical protein